MDPIASRILEELRRDGRIGQNELATRLGISRPTVAKHLRALLDSGRVRVVGMVHPYTVGISTIAHVALSVNGPARDIAEKLRGFASIPFVALTSGTYPLICEIRVRDAPALATALDQIRSIDGVVSTKTALYSAILVDIGRPDCVPSTVIDRIDSILLAALQRDGRSSFEHLGVTAGVSAGTARTRVRRLLDEKVVRIGALARAGEGESEVAVGFGITVTGSATEIGQLLAPVEGVLLLAVTIGRYDLIGTVLGADYSEVVATLDTMRKLPQVNAVETWVHFDTVKEQYDYSA